MKKSLRLPLLLLISSAVLVFLAEFIHSRAKLNPQEIVARAQENLRKLEEKMTESLSKVSEINNDSAFHRYFMHEGFQKLGFSFFYIENEIITKWSDNETEINTSIADTCKPNSLIHLNNGWYEVFIHHEAEKEIVGLLLIRKEFAYENQYLVNEFNPELHLPYDCELTEVNDKNSFAVQSINNEPLFAIRFLPGAGESTEFNSYSWLYLYSFLIFLLAVFLASRSLSTRFSLLPFLFMAGIIAVRALMIHAHWPDEFYTTDFFSPQLYASSFYFNSLGDLFINAMCLFCISGILFHCLENKIFSFRKKIISTLVRTGSLISLFFLALPLDNLVRGLVLNSKISFDISNVFSLNEYGLAGFVVIAALLSSYFLIALALSRFFFNAEGKSIAYRELIISFGIFTVIYFVVKSQDLIFPLSRWLLALTIALVIFLFMRLQRNEGRLRVNFLLGITLLFSVYASLLIWNMNNKKEKENRKLLVQKIETGQDQIAEYLFEDMKSKIRSDQIIQSHFKDTLRVPELVNRRLFQFYFTGYWAKFNISISCYDRNGMPFDTTQSNALNEKLIKDIRENRNLDELSRIHFLRDETGQQQYTAYIPVQSHTNSDSPAGVIEIVFIPKFFQTGEGFPELFVSSKVANSKELNNYSFARYQNDTLLNQSGVFAYFFSLNHFRPTRQEYTFVSLHNFNHLVHRVNHSLTVIISKSEESPLIFITLFSYLFSFFSLLLLLCYVTWRMVSRKISFHFSLTRRIQFAVMMLVILSFVLTGSGTMYYMVNKYDVENDKSINEKASSLTAVMEKELAESERLKPKLTDETHALLNSLSGTSKADFNIYTLAGDLYYSSQPKIFEQGIISRKINPDAMFEISDKGQTQFIHPESIGKLNYIAAYEPLRNKAGKQIGYLHLPYFEKQNELNKEISNFLSALINIYMLLFACALLIAFFISSRITHPLLLIQEKLSGIRLGKRNELIEYRKRDEIGELVNEYNRMVNEITASAEKLARSERESAWREMAKQVAHEIKNPLTPMKLSLQHLQRAWDEKSENLQDIFQRISQTLVQQIDSLSSIATEFSNFAQMPPAKKELVDLVKIVSVCVDLFKEEGDIQVVVEDKQKDKFVFADKNQLIRLFSNLLKNAIQAIPSGKPGKIEIRITTSTNNHLVSVHDNGVGISPEEKNKIFTPSFTTKSGGMGLGLSIVKSIVESSGGTIWFKSETQTGTIFYIQLPSALAS